MTVRVEQARTIWRYELTMDEVQVVPIPPDAAVRHVALSERLGRPCLWVELDPEQSVVPRLFQVVGTGHDVPADGEYVGTWQDRGYVWHLYEVPS